MKQVILAKGREKSVERFHPWIFSGAIKSVDTGVEDGDIVTVCDAGGSFLGRGHFAVGSLAVKILTFEDIQIDEKWFENRLMQAFEMRKSLGFPNAKTNAFRLVHGEGDALPGLVIDVYDRIAVVQPHSLGMSRCLGHVKNALQTLGFEHIVHKPIGKADTQILLGNVGERIQICEHGIAYQVDVLRGQKTGFFLDQRENRRLLAAYAQDKSVLNVFSYSGGFSMSAAKGGAQKIISVDASQAALDLAEANAQLNGVAEIHSSFKADAIPFLESYGESVDVIVLDPPAFAKHKSARHSAIQAYRRINQAALEKLNSGGVLFTFSCSQAVDTALFYGMITSAAINARKQVQVLHHLRQPADHPVNLFHPEGEYLKGLVLRVF